MTSVMKLRFVSLDSKTTGATSGAETACTSGAHSVCNAIRVAQSLDFCLVSVDNCFFFFFSFFLSFHYLSYLKYRAVVVVIVW